MAELLLTSTGRVLCPLCRWDAVSVGALRHHVKHHHGRTLGQILGKLPHSHPHNLTHCPRGHAYTAENIYFNPSRPGVKHCKACRAIHQEKRIRERSLERAARR